MNKAAKLSTMINYVLSGLGWLLAISFFALNAARCWELWQGVGFLLIYYAVAPAVAQIVSAVLSVISRDKRLMIANAISLVVSVGIALLTALVSVNYG